MRTTILRTGVFLAVWGMCNSRPALADDGLVPCWRGQDGSTFQAWEFLSAANPASPDSVTNAYGLPQATIVVGPAGAGWQSQLPGLGSQTGGWDLGSNGAITLTVPNRTNASPASYKYLWIQVSQWLDGSNFNDYASVSVPGAALEATNLLVAQDLENGARWMIHQSRWLLAPSPESETVTLTSAATGSIVDQVVVDTVCVDLAYPTDLVLSADSDQCSKSNVTWTLPPVDGCIVSNSICSPPIGSTFLIGTQQVTCLLIDSVQRTNMCAFTVTVMDTMAPVMVCQANVITNAEPGRCDRGGVVLRSPVVGDNCGVASVVSNAPARFPVGVTAVTWTATDIHGNQSTCVQTVTVRDNQPPVMSGCPASRILTNEPGQCSAIVTWITPIATDNCSATLPVTCVPPSGTRFNNGSTPVSCSTVDGAGNSAYCWFIITVVDREPPQFTECPTNVLVAAETGSCTAVASWPAPTALDQCDGAVGVTCVPPSGSAFNVGHTTVTCTARDATNNTATCSFVITVADREPPQFTECPTNVLVAAETGSCTAVASWPAPTALDQCDGSVGVTCVPPSGSAFNAGRTTVTCTARDATSNAVTCNFVVTVNLHPNDVPTLDIALQGPSNDWVVVSWPRVCSDLYQLEETESLSTPITWLPVTDPVVLEGERFVMRRQAAQPSRCYRLHFRE